MLRILGAATGARQERSLKMRADNVPDRVGASGNDVRDPAELFH
jgi:hypothetical protein